MDILLSEMCIRSFFLFLNGEFLKKYTNFAKIKNLINHIKPKKQ